MAKDAALQKHNQRQWYLRNRFRIRDGLRIYSKQNKKKVWNWFRDYKSKLTCSRCSENHPACLHFHHRNPADKAFSISTAVRNGLCIITLLAEISKCDVLCANCHAKQHFAS